MAAKRRRPRPRADVRGRRIWYSAKSSVLGDRERGRSTDGCGFVAWCRSDAVEGPPGPRGGYLLELVAAVAPLEVHAQRAGPPARPRGRSDERDVACRESSRKRCAGSLPHLNLGSTTRASARRQRLDADGAAGGHVARVPAEARRHAAQEERPRRDSRSGNEISMRMGTRSCARSLFKSRPAGQSPSKSATEKRHVVASSPTSSTSKTRGASTTSAKPGTRS